MLPAIFVEVEAVLVFRLFRRILYLDNKEDVQRWREWRSCGRGERKLNVVERLVLVLASTTRMSILGYVVLI